MKASRVPAESSRADRSLEAVLISCYEMGRQPFGLASPAAWLREAGIHVTCIDISVEDFDEDVVRDVDLIAFHLPMHTATRIAAGLVARVKVINPRAHVCAYGLYAPLNETYLRGLGVDSVIGGEFETGLRDLAESLARAVAPSNLAGSVVLKRQLFLTPERADLPDLEQYAHLHAEGHALKKVGYTEATRGCKHLCRHCPIVPVYNGRFFVIQPEVVLSDIANLVKQGAEHITFGDPDFFNGPGHAVRIVEALHGRWPELTYDVTIKVSHLLALEALLPTLRDTGCAFVTSAVEALDDEVLRRFDKGHTREDFIHVARSFGQLGLILNPTFVTFTPWTTLMAYADLLAVIDRLGLIESTAPIQYAIRLLVTSGSRLLELQEVRDLVDDFDEEALAFPWRHPDERMDRLHQDVLRIVKDGGRDRREIFGRVRARVEEQLGGQLPETEVRGECRVAATIPYLTEPWYC